MLDAYRGRDIILAPTCALVRMPTVRCFVKPDHVGPREDVAGARGVYLLRLEGRTWRHSPS